MDKEKFDYNKNRMYKRANSALRSLDIPFEDVMEYANTLGQPKTIQKQIDRIYNSFGELLSLIQSLPQKGEKNGKEKDKPSSN